MHKKFRGEAPKKSRNLIAASCCFCGWIDFGVLCGFGLGLRAMGTLPLPVGIFVGHVWLLSVFFELVNGTRRRRKPGTKKGNYILNFLF